MDDENSLPVWKTPDEVMKLNRLQRKLNRRITEKSSLSFTCSTNINVSEDSLMEFPVLKRKYPFHVGDKINGKRSCDSRDSGVEADSSSHSGERSIFNFNTRLPSSPSTPTTFSNIINRLTPVKPNNGVRRIISPESGTKRIPVDWSLKHKMRFMSTRPFSWSASMRTSEEVSAVTGFARCLEPGLNREGAGDFDTSANAQFHRCCMYWKHPHLPWLPLFARSTSKLSSTLIAAQLQIADVLHQEWTLAFKSLLQLLRTQKCPYFYIIGTQFHCLFRAAGIAGQQEANVLISPTTRGFRKMLDDEGIGFAMPLRKRISQLDSSASGDESNSGNQEMDPDDDVEDWMDSEQVRKLTIAQRSKDRRKESKLDGSGDSLVMVSGADLQGLFNFLVNCKNNMDRLPPTLVAPTAFQLASLQTCQVLDSVVQVDGVELYSVQIEGPIMPHALAQMCLLLDESNIEYSAAVATVKQTTSFTSVHVEQDPIEKPSSMFFLKEYLNDSGLSKRVLSRLCESDPTQFGVIDSIEPQQVM